MHKSILFALILILFSHPAQASEKPTIFVSILPQKFFVQKIAGDTLTVKSMVAPGANPVTYEPKPSQMAALAKSVAYLSIGVPFEQSWLPRFEGVTDNLTIIATDKGIAKRHMESDHHHDEDEHHHGGQDPHIWLSPELVKTQALTISKALSQLFPKNSAIYQKNLDTFIKEINTLQQQIKKRLGNRQQPFLVFHPSWGYFAQEFQLDQEAIELEGKSIKPKKIAEIINFCQAHGITTIFAQPQFSQRSAQLIAAAINGKVVSIDPLAEKWDQNLMQAASALSKEQ